MSPREELLQELRPVAFAIAYQMLGSVAEAEDVVQEALLQVHQALEAGEQVASPRALVATVTTRRAIDQLRSARARRERYVGQWLPVLHTALLAPVRPTNGSTVEAPASASLRQELGR